MKKAALTALVLGSLTQVSSDQMMIKDPGKEFKELGAKYRFGEPMPAKKPVVPAAQTPQAAPVETTIEPEAPAAKKRVEPLADPFGGKNLHLSCGAKCGIPLSDQNRS